MKTKDSIYIVKGKAKSTLINLATREIRSISNIQLEQLGEDIDLEEELLGHVLPEIEVYQKEILDIRISKEFEAKEIFSALNKHIKEGTAYLNVRIICPEKEEVSLDCVKAFISWINKTIFHFGLIISVPESYNKELFFDSFSAHKVIFRKTTSTNSPNYEPTFYVSPNSIFISKNNNLYHYSRDSLTINGDKVIFTDHDQFNIPKSKIENCKDCEFRLTCFDLREVRQTEEKYYYDTTCQYELDR